MADNNNIRLHGRQVTGRIDQSFALFKAAGGGGNIEGVGTHALGRNLEGEAGSGTRLKKEIDDGSASQGGNFFDLVGGYFFK